MALYFEGYSQSAIANKLNVDQSTVSLHVSKFKSSVDQQGIKAAGEEFDIMNTVDELHSLAAELKKSKITVEEAKVGFKMERLFQKLGVKAEDYQDVIQAATKMKAEGFLESAAELNKLEESTGMTHEEIVVQSANTCQQLKSDQQDLEIVTGALNAAKEDLVAIENQKQLASQDLQAHMQQIDVDMNRLLLVEELASTLKKAGVSNENLKDYTQRQQLLNEAGIGIDIFVSILEKADVVTSKDHEEGQTGRRSVDLSVSPAADIMIQARQYSIFDPITVFECKRLPIPSRAREKEYVTGGTKKKSGGIQRFKLGLHGANHDIVAMIGYLQEGSANDWYNRINKWLAELSSGRIADVCVWDKNETLQKFEEDSSNEIANCESKHSRNGGTFSNEIVIHHLWIKMRPII